MVEIIMAAYNGEKYIKEQLDSVFLGNGQEFFLHVYDDCSTDNTRDILREYKKQYPNRLILHFNKEKKGVFRNFMEGFINTVSDYVMFADQDDVWLPGKLERTLKYMKYCEKKRGDCPITVFTDAVVVDSELRELAPSFQALSKYRTDRRSLSGLLMENKLMGCTMMMNKRVREYIWRLPKNARMHDWWLGLVSAAFGYIGYLNEPSMLYRQHGDNGVGTKNYLKYFLDRLKSPLGQRKALRETVKQGREFLEIYEEELSEKQRESLSDFAALYDVDWLSRRRIVWEHGFLKSTFLRNVGLFFLL